MTIHRPMLRYGVFLFLTATAVLLFSQSASAQWTGNGNDVYKNPTTGNVGIGTPNPTAVLNVVKNQPAGTEIRVNNSDAAGFAGLYFNGGFTLSSGGFVQYNNNTGFRNL